MSEVIIGRMVDLTKASVPDLLGEIERRGISLPQVSFELIQKLHELRNQRWNANNGGGMKVEPVVDHFMGNKFRVVDDKGETVAAFVNESDANTFANPQFTVFERAAEVAGEIGELVNAVKKLRRHDMKMPGNYKPGEQDRQTLLENAAYEIGDGFVTLFNLCNKLNVPAWTCLQVAFNTKSHNMNFPEKL